MQIVDFKQKENPLLYRKELVLDISFDKSTPSRKQVIQSVKDKVGCDEKLVVIKSISNYYGTNKALVEAFVYDDEKALKFGSRHLLIRSMDKEKQKEEREKAKAEKKKAKK